jgi:hypothetical protein
MDTNSWDDISAAAKARDRETVRNLPGIVSTAGFQIMAASIFMLRRADELFAVWDGLPARGYAGTADVVAHARQHGIKVCVLWPPGSRRR